MSSPEKTKFPFYDRPLTSEEEHELKTRLQSLDFEGRQVEATSPTVNVTIRPDYYNEELFKRAQKTVNKYYTSVSMSSSVGLMLLLQIDEILIPLLRTGKSRTVADLYDRYTATAKYIKYAYESDFMEADSTGWQYINLVRSMHKRAYTLLNSADCEHLTKPSCKATDDGSYVWINQYDMALTQFAFVGLFVLRPDKCGAHNISESELGDITYYWRLLSYQFGIEERFNIFHYHGDMAKGRRFLGLLLEHYKEKLMFRSPLGLEMSRGFLLAFEDLSTETTFNILENHWRDVISLSGEQRPARYDGLGERWKLIRFNIIFGFLFKSQLIMEYMNGFYKQKFETFCKRSKKIKRKLTKKYPNHIYELEGATPEFDTIAPAMESNSGAKSD